ncbi:hypothetical protein, partial [Vescimonas sp.]|uniref:hypothetical protein n=1 Tax=Vescimonas sp. TaxID=2892404 RepID=UPI0030777690
VTPRLLTGKTPLHFYIIHRLFHTGKNLVGKRFSTLCTGFSTGRKRSFTPEQKGEYNLHNVKM